MDRREQIRRGAIEVIAEKGFHAATTDMIARAAGVAVGTIYNYFDSKEEILGYIFEVERRRRMQLLKGLAHGKDSARDRFREFLKFHFNEIQKEPALGRLLLQECRLTDHSELLPLREFSLHMPALLAEVLKTDDQDETAEMRGIAAFGAVQVLTTQVLFAPEQLRMEDLECALDYLSDLLAPIG